MQNVEVLVADDCSTDHLYLVASSISDSRLHLWQFTQNHGTVCTLNFLFEHAKGEYIATLGSDDLFYPEKLEKQLEEVLEKKPQIATAFSWADIIDEDGRIYQSGNSIPRDVSCKQNKTPAEWCRYFFENGNTLCHSSALIRSTVQRELGEYHAKFR